MSVIIYKGKERELKFDFDSVLTMYENGVEPCDFLLPDVDRGTTRKDFYKAWGWFFGETVDADDNEQVNAFVDEFSKSETPYTLHIKAFDAINEATLKRLAIVDKALSFKKKAKVKSGKSKKK